VKGFLNDISLGLAVLHNPFINSIVATNTGNVEGWKQEDDASNNGNHLES